MEFFVYTLVAFLFRRASQVLKLNPTTKNVILQNQVAAECAQIVTVTGMMVCKENIPKISQMSLFQVSELF